MNSLGKVGTRNIMNTHSQEKKEITKNMTPNKQTTNQH